jgi:hypothetical protein
MNWTWRFAVELVVLFPSLPLAMTWGVRESETAAPQAPVPLFGTVTELQVIRNAESGTFPQPVTLAAVE